MKIEKVIYRAKANSTGGREGKSATAEGNVQVKLTTPKEMGGAGGDGTNPEQLFAMGYSACFLGAMKFVAMQEKTKLPDETHVEGTVGIGAIPSGFGIEVELKISVPGMDKNQVRSIVDKAHIVCPYSNATKGNIQVALTIV